MKCFEVLEETGLGEPTTPIGVIDRDEELDLIFNKYPAVPRSFILKTDALRRGVQFTSDAIKKAQDPCLEINSMSYTQFQFYQMDYTGEYTVPFSFIFDDAVLVGIRLSPPETQPYTIDFVDDEFWLFSGDEKLERITFNRKPKYYGKKTSFGVLMELIAQSVGTSCLGFVHNRHCHYWNEGLQCRYCDLVYNLKHQLKKGVEGFKTRCTPQDFYETTYEALDEKGKWNYCFINGGSNPKEGYKNDFEFMKDMAFSVVKAAKDREVEGFGIQTITTPYRKEELIELKEGGVTGFGTYFEIWDEEKFKLICPGKSKYLGRKEWWKRSIDAVEVFGRGNVAAGFVPGVELSPPPYGFSNADVALESTLGGYKKLIQNGIVPTAVNWVIEPGTVFYEMGAKQPSLEFTVRLDIGRYELLKKYGNGISADLLGYKGNPWSCYTDYQRLL